MRGVLAGKVTVYLGKRDFIDHLDSVDPIDGVVVVDSDYLKGRRIYGQVRSETFDLVTCLTFMYHNKPNCLQ